MYDDFDTQVQIDELASLYDNDLWDCYGNYEGILYQDEDYEY